MSTSRIKNTDNLIQSNSYYDQIYSTHKDTVNLPKIDESDTNLAFQTILGDEHKKISTEPANKHWCMKNNERIEKANSKVKVVKR